MLVITVARKPLEEPTVAKNAMVYGTGGLNIDASRIGTGTVKQATAGTRTIKWGIGEGGCSYEKGTGAVFSIEGRWPANLILCPEVAKGLDEQTGTLTSGGKKGGEGRGGLSKGSPFSSGWNHGITHGDTGGASRFFKVVQS